MPLPIPSLDDKSFDDLVAEGHALVPRAFPAWSDHNQSDPGVTLLELFAFLVESLLYRFDRVPDRTLVNLAALVGVRPAPGETTDQLLARAVATVSRPTCAVTGDDVAALVLSDFLAVRPALDRELAAGTEAALLGVLPSATALTQAAPADDGSTTGPTLALAEGPVLVPGDVVLLGSPDGADQIEFAVVHAVASSGDRPGVSLEAPLRFPHPAGTPVRVVDASGPVPTTSLASMAPDGAGTVAVMPLPEQAAATVVRLRDAAGAQYGWVTPAAARCEVIARPVATPSAADATRVVVVPAGQPDPFPMPGDLGLQQVFDLLRARTLLATRLQVMGPRYRPMTISATVVRDVGTLLRKDTVQAVVEQALQRYLSPLLGGALGHGWEFGRPVYRSELYALLEGVRGVDHVAQLLLDGDEFVAALPLAADPAEASESLVELAGLEVTVLDPGPGAAA